jgi:hypothetical protein
MKKDTTSIASVASIAFWFRDTPFVFPFYRHRQLKDLSIFHGFFSQLLDQLNILHILLQSIQHSNHLSHSSPCSGTDFGDGLCDHSSYIRVIPVTGLRNLSHKMFATKISNVPNQH